MTGIRQGSLIEGRYAAECQIGQGGAAVVYLCRHVSLGSEHAIKISKRCSPMAARRVLAEGRAQAKLVHPNVVRVTDSCMVDGAPALVMEFVRGPSLATLLQRMRFTQAQVDDLARGILSGVAAAHEQGVVHRDLKPANILVDVTKGRPIPKIADFGLVKTFDLPELRSRRTRSGSTMGTPEYMSPEQIRNAREVDARADVFSIGAVLYELVTGVRCFHAPDLLTVFNRIAQGEYRPVEELVPSVPLRVVRAIESALEPDRDRRCQTIEQLMALWFEGAARADFDPWDDDGTYRRAVADWSDASQTPPPSDIEESVCSLDAALAGPAVEPAADVPWVPGTSSYPAAATCSPTAPVADGEDLESDPVWLATRGQGPVGGTKLWLAAGAIAAALGMNAGLAGMALAWGLQLGPTAEAAAPPTGDLASAVGLECDVAPAEEPIRAPERPPARAATTAVAPTEGDDATEPRGPFKRLFDRSPQADEDRAPRRERAAVRRE